jgi:phosphonate transport system ATP-binding protein
MVGVIGASGAGKSTLLRMINRLIDPSEGRIAFHDAEVSTLSGQALRNWQRDCAMIFQQFNLVPRLDVLTNVLLGRLNHRSTLSSVLNMFTRDERAMAIASLERLDIAKTAMQRAGTLSGGQQQRVAIARALMQQPKMILADEPIASLDPRNAQIVMQSLHDINRSDGITVITNLHTLDTARAYCERIIGMSGGRGRIRRCAGRPDRGRGTAHLRRGRAGGSLLGGRHLDELRRRPGEGRAETRAGGGRRAALTANRIPRDVGRVARMHFSNDQTIGELPQTGETQCSRNSF